MEELQAWLDSLEPPYDVAEWMHQMKQDDSGKSMSSLNSTVKSTAQPKTKEMFPTVDENVEPAQLEYFCLSDS